MAHCSLYAVRIHSRAYHINAATQPLRIRNTTQESVDRWIFL